MSIFDDMLAAGASTVPAGAVDPYAPIRNLKFSKYNYTVPGLNDSEAGAAAQDQTYQGWALANDLIPYGEGTMPSGKSSLGGGFQSKYNQLQEVDPEKYPGLMQMTVQRQDAGASHKYDTQEVFYQMNPVTGEAVMVGEPIDSRQVSTAEGFRDVLEQKILPAVALVATAGYATGAFGAGAVGAAETGALTGVDAAMADYAASGAGAGLFEGGAAAGGLTGVDAAMADYAASGGGAGMEYGVSGAAEAAGSALPYEQTVDIPGQRLPAETNFGNPEIDNLVTQVGSNGNPLGQTVPSNFGNPEADNLAPQVDASGNPLGQTVAATPVTPTTPATSTPSTTPSTSTPSTTPAAFDWGKLMTGVMSGLSGLYGMHLADNMREASDPFAKYRDYYGEQLMSLEKNPSTITQRPGWTAGIEAIDRSAASKGYIGSGNAMAALSRYGGNFYNDEAKRLAGLAGAGQTPGAGQAGAANLDSSSLEGIAGGIGQLIELLGGKP